VLLIPFLIAMFLAINMGGSGTSPSFSAAYGSNIIKKNLIPGLFGLFVLLGALIAGRKVILTISGGILPVEDMNASLATLLLFSSAAKGVPVSLVQTSTAAIMGLGASKVGWGKILANNIIKRLLVVWVISPLISLCLSFLFTTVEHKLNLL